MWLDTDRSTNGFQSYHDDRTGSDVYVRHRNRSCAVQDESSLVLGQQTEIGYGIGHGRCVRTALVDRQRTGDRRLIATRPELRAGRNRVAGGRVAGIRQVKQIQNGRAGDAREIESSSTGQKMF